MAVRVTPEQATTKWVNRLSGATEEIKQGVAAVTKAPGAQAAAAHAKWLQNTQAAAAKWQRNVAAVSLSEWQHLMTNVGIPRIAQGAQAKQSKYQAFAASFFPHLNAGISQVRAMPSVTLEDNIQRAVAMMRHNATYKRPAGAA